jgi:uncharacterized membrane protein YqjE
MTTDYKQVLNEMKSYANMRFDLIRLELLEKLSKIISLILLVVVCILISVIIFTYLSVLLLLWLNEVFSSMIPGVCIVAGIYAIALTIMILFKEKIFLNPIIGALSKIIFSDKEPKQDVTPINPQP